MTLLAKNTKDLSHLLRNEDGFRIIEELFKSKF